MDLDITTDSADPIAQGQTPGQKENIESEGEALLVQTNPRVANGQLIADRLLKIHALLDELTSSPWSHDMLELVVATTISPLVSAQDNSAKVWLIIAAPPSGDKTATVYCLRDTPTVRFVDSLTDNALASGYAPEKGPREPDLLTQMERDGSSCLVFKDFTTVFSMKDDRVKKFLGELQSVFDGEFVKATGTIGLRRYSTNFAMVACITPLALANHHRYMASIGARFLTYAVPRLTDDQREEGFRVTWDGKERKEKLKQLRALVRDHISQIHGVGFEIAPETPDQRAVLNLLAEFVAHGRAAVKWHRTSWDQWEIDCIQVEEPFRILQQLRNLGRALACVHGRMHITDHEIELLRTVALGTFPVDRAAVLHLFASHPAGLTTNECAQGIGKSQDRARQLLDELRTVGVLHRCPGVKDSEGRPADIYLPVDKFSPLISKPKTPIDHLIDLGSEFSDKTPPRGMFEQGEEDR